MTRYLRREIEPIIARAFNENLSNEERGRAFEELAVYLFSKVPGVTVAASNSVDVFTCQEIDVVLVNAALPNGLHGFDAEILVECKNWTQPVGSSEVAWFDTKLRTRGLRHGFLFAANGITGNSHSRTSAHQIIASALAEGRRIVVLSARDLASVRTSAQLAQLVRDRMTLMLLSRGLP